MVASLSSKIARTTQKLSLKKERKKTLSLKKETKMERGRERKEGRKGRKEAGKATTQSMKDEMAALNILNLKNFKMSYDKNFEALSQML